MQRKSTLVTLGILGAVALGACCCCTGMIDDENRVQGHGGGHGRTHFFWYGGWSSHAPAPTGHPTGTPSATGRGGFGATGAAHGGGTSAGG